jgi:multicomponent Na+:H+ antiporter subunit E
MQTARAATPQNVRVTPSSPSRRFTTVLLRLGVLALLWFSLLEGHTEALLLSLLAVPLAVWVGVAPEQPMGRRIRPLAMARFLPFLLWRALCGSMEVVRRVLGRRQSVEPRKLLVRSRLMDETARLFLCTVVSLLPGSLVVKVEGNQLTLHLKDASPESRTAALSSLRDLEMRVAHVFGLPPPPRALP